MEGLDLAVRLHRGWLAAVLDSQDRFDLALFAVLRNRESLRNN